MDPSNHEWYADQEYWTVNRNLIWSDRLVSGSGIAAEKIFSLLGMEKGETLLDIPCGFGRHSLEFSRLGLRVTGVDLNPALISEARASASSENLDVVFLEEDMREFRSAGSFDHIVILFNSFGYFRDREDDSRVLENCFASLKQGGDLLIAIPGREILRRQMKTGSNRHWREEKGVIVLEESTVEDDWNWISTRWKVIDGDARSEWEYGMRIYGEAELVSLLEECGFTDIRTMGHLGGVPYDDDARALITLSRKC